MHCGPDCRICHHLRRATIEAAAKLGIAELDECVLAGAAGLPLRAVRLHGPGTIPGWIASAYEQSAQDLQTCFEVDLMGGASWADGLRRATQHLVWTLTRDPDRARFCYVEVLRGEPALRAHREAVRRRSIELFTREYAHRHGTERLPSVKLELACNSIIHTIATHASQGRVSELPKAVDAMLVAAGACEPPAYA
jgi:hypothetical protein